MTVRRLHFARRQRHLDNRGLRLLPVQLLDDVLLGEQLDLNASLVVTAVLRQRHPAKGESTKDNRQQAASHDFSSDKSKVCSRPLDDQFRTDNRGEKSIMLCCCKPAIETDILPAYLRRALRPHRMENLSFRELDASHSRAADLCC